MGIAVPAAVVGAPRGRTRGRLALGILATVAATAITAVVAVGGAQEDPALVALGRCVIVATPCAVGLYAWYRGSGARFGLLLLATGGLACVASLSESAASGPYTLGRTAGWVSEVALVYLMLAFPTGRLPARADRLMVAGIAAVVAVAFLPRLVLAGTFEVPNPYTSCTAGCPENALFLLSGEPAIVADVMRPAGVVLVGIAMLAVVVRLWGRLVDATPLARRMFAPVLAIAMLRAGLLGAGIAVRLVDPHAPGLEVVAWLLALAMPALALAFLAGLVHWRVFTGTALGRLAVALREEPGRAGLRRAFAGAFRDPRADVVFPAPPGSATPWADADGVPVRLPATGSGRAVTLIEEEHGHPAAALVHDEALRGEELLLRAGAAIAATAIERRRLAEEVGQAMREVRRSRARIAASAERERRRLERDLHDGAQQRLVALRIELELAEELVRRDPDGAAHRLRELGDEVDEAIDELRALAHGVYPPLLADRGLAEALDQATGRSPVPVEVSGRVGRHPPEIESAVYFCVLEACQNALKHAEGARRIRVELAEAAGELRFSVRDDGLGFEAGSHADGHGIANMCDRVAAVGGELEISSARNVGTVLRGRVPIDQEIP